MAIGESERLSCIEGARSALERTATGLVAVLFVPLVAAQCTRSVPSRKGHCRKAEKCYGSNKDNAARTCKKLPVASFCASETAETGRIANGREQGDHVGGDRAAKDLILFVRNRHCGELNRGLQNLDSFFWQRI